MGGARCVKNHQLANSRPRSTLGLAHRRPIRRLPRPRSSKGTVYPGGRLLSGLMPHATMAKCIRVAQQEQEEIAGTWLAVKGPFGEAVPTLCACMTGAASTRGTRAREACTSSSSKQRKHSSGGASHCRNGAKASPAAPSVFAPLRRALTCKHQTSQEQAYLRSVFVDGQWTQTRKHQAARHCT